MSEIIFLEEVSFQLMLLRFILYILTPSILGTGICLRLFSKFDYAIAIPLGGVIGLVLLGGSNLVGEPLSRFLYTGLSGFDNLQICLISFILSLFVSFLFIFSDRIVNLFITDPNSVTSGETYTSISTGESKVVATVQVDLITQLSRESASATRYKVVILNIFIFVNALFIGFYFLKSDSLSNFELGATSAIYISLSMFMVYIFRTSNARLTTLLSIQEDIYKKERVNEYMKRITLGESPSDNDIEIIRMLLINRSERERPTNHPYEILMKGISNSNIQLKGGKLEASAGADKTPTK